MPNMSRLPAIEFANQLRSARLFALADAEAFDGMIHAMERIGAFLCAENLGAKGKHGDLGKYRSALTYLANRSGLAFALPNSFPWLFTPFDLQYKLMKDARNDALHQGAFARHLTKNAVELSITLEDALSTFRDPIVSDFMVRNPVSAELWQPVGFVRQQMLANSFSYIPICTKEKQWRLLSDHALVSYLGAERGSNGRTKRLSTSVGEAIEAKHLQLTDVETSDPSASIADAIEKIKKVASSMILVPDRSEGSRLVGILTAFDLL